MRDSFIFYRSFYEALLDLPDANQLEVFQAIANYSLNGELPKFSGISKTVFTLILPQLEANRKRYQNGSQPKKNRKKSKAEANTKQNGSKHEAKEKQEESKTEANKNVNENVNKNSNKNVNQNQIGVVFPFDSDAFMSEWKTWCAYRKEQGVKAYKPIGEQAALMKLSKLARNDTEAIAIIRQSIENGWKGFFELKQKQNGKRIDIAELVRNIQ